MILRTTVSPMAMRKRRRHAKQPSMWVATEDLPRSAAHPVLQATESDLRPRRLRRVRRRPLTQLAQASGIATPTREDLARIDRKRPKKGSNDDWAHPLDPDAKITKMKDGRTHLAHKAEHAVDLETGAVVGVTVQDADQGDTATSIETLIEAAEQVETVVPDGEIKEVVADKGYHSNQELVDLEAVGVRSYISEPDRGRRKWKDNPEARDAVYRNRRRVLLHTAALNLGLLMRTLFGVGTPRSLRGRMAVLLCCVWSLIRLPETLWDAIWTVYRPSTSLNDLLAHRLIRPPALSVEAVFITGGSPLGLRP
jgi:hypothetical protein